MPSLNALTLSQIFVSQSTPVGDPVAVIVGAASSVFQDVTITALTAEQAAGTAHILPSDPTRQTLMISPPAACFLTLASGATHGQLMRGGEANVLVGTGCPTNELFIYNLQAGDLLVMWKA